VGGASYLFPLDVMAAYIGPSPNHQNGRVSSIRTRFMAGAFCSARGVSLSEAEIEDNEADIIQYMKFAKDTAGDMIGGRFDRVKNTGNEIAWQYTSKDENTVYLAYFHILSAPNLPFRRTRLVGLNPTATYRLEDGKSELYGGDMLMESGMPMPQVSTGEKAPHVRYMPDGDFSSHIFVFQKVTG
jgi:alpha-galactosidase